MSAEAAKCLNALGAQPQHEGDEGVSVLVLELIALAESGALTVSTGSADPFSNVTSKLTELYPESQVVKSVVQRLNMASERARKS